jgi:hypothetical protein
MSSCRLQSHQRLDHDGCARKWTNVPPVDEIITTSDGHGVFLSGWLCARLRMDGTRSRDGAHRLLERHVSDLRSNSIYLFLVPYALLLIMITGRSRIRTLSRSNTRKGFKAILFHLMGVSSPDGVSSVWSWTSDHRSARACAPSLTSVLELRLCCISLSSFPNRGLQINDSFVPYII